MTDRQNLDALLGQLLDPSTGRPLTEHDLLTLPEGNRQYTVFDQDNVGAGGIEVDLNYLDALGRAQSPEERAALMRVKCPEFPEAAIRLLAGITDFDPPAAGA